MQGRQFRGLNGLEDHNDMIASIAPAGFDSVSDGGSMGP